MERRLCLVAFVFVSAVLVFLGGAGVTGVRGGGPQDEAYNRMARGFLSGHLYADKVVPPAFAALPDPYDPVQSAPFRSDPRYDLHDYSYYGGRLYLYFGAVPALVAFIPWHLLTGGWLPHWLAVVLACLGGLAANAATVGQVRRVCYPRAPAWTEAACTLVLGLASYAPVLAARADMWEIPIAFQYLFVSLALRWVARAVFEPDRAVTALGLASAAFGAAFACRPTVLPAAGALLLPLLALNPRPGPRAWMAAALPLVGFGLAVAAYNAARFGNPFEFGMRYQVANEYMSRRMGFRLSYLASNLPLYWVQPVRLASFFPFLREPLASTLHAHLPEGHGGTEHLSGALLLSPVLLAAVLLPAWGGRRVAAFAAAVAWVALCLALLVSCFFGACSRYQFDFLPWVALLACLGILAAEDHFHQTPGRVRLTWVPLLALSCALPVLYAVDRCVGDHNAQGFLSLLGRDLPGAEREFASARALAPGNPTTRLGEAWILLGTGQPKEAEAAYRAIIDDFPLEGPVHYSLANLLRNEGRFRQALSEYEWAHALEPDDEAERAALERARVEAASGVRARP
jgi:tetratricopeptide (TPR) repeat protein